MKDHCNSRYRKIFYFLYLLMHNFGCSEWSSWSEWSTCSRTCGYGVQTQTRQCEQSPCSTGQSVRIVGCNVKSCDSEDDSVWSTWSSWSDCSQTCGGGTKSRYRGCETGTNSDCCTSADDETCRLEYQQTRQCINDDCPSIDHWSDWRPWGRCSASCGEGRQVRGRSCEPINATCLGPGEQHRPCYVQCKIDPDVLQQLDGQTHCSPDTCKNGGLCVSSGDKINCNCEGQWRGKDCSILCLPSVSGSACTGKHGLYYVCDDCHSFIVCASDRRLLQACIPPRIWTGNGCKLPWDKDAICIEERFK